MNSGSTSNENKSRHNNKITIAMNSFQEYEKSNEDYGETSTKSSSITTIKSKNSNFRLAKEKLNDSDDFQINLINLSPRAKKDNEYSFCPSELK